MKRRLFASLIGIVLVAALAIGFTVGAGDKPSLGLDLQGGASITLQPEGEYDALALDVAVEIIRSRVDAIGVAEPEIIRQGDTVVVNLPGVKDQQRALDIVGRTGDLQLRPVLQQGSVDPTAGTDSSGSQTPSTPTTIPVGTSVPSDTTVPEEGGPGESRGARPMVDTTVHPRMPPPRVPCPTAQRCSSVATASPISLDQWLPLGWCSRTTRQRTSKDRVGRWSCNFVVAPRAKTFGMRSRPVAIRATPPVQPRKWPSSSTAK
jgi:hypothetical protein